MICPFVYPILTISAAGNPLSLGSLERSYPRNVSSRNRVSSAVNLSEPDKTTTLVLRVAQISGGSTH